MQTILKKTILKIPKINLSLQLALIIAGTFIFGNYINPTTKSTIYTVSLLLKEILVFILPFIIFSCLFYSLSSIQNRALKFIIILLSSVCLSNFISILSAYGFAKFGLSHVNLSPETQNISNSLEPIFDLKLPTLIKTEYALFLGLAFGLFFSIFRFQPALNLAKKANHLVNLFLQKFFVPNLPIFAFGYILKIQHEGILTQVVSTYAPIVLLMILTSIIYISILFAIAAGFNPKNWLNYIKNVIPVGILGFTTMSSLATMPVTLTAAEKNTNDPETSRAVIPATANIHMLGDSLCIPILAMAVLLTFSHDLPNFNQYLLFTYFFMIAKFAVPGIPCGTIIVMLPILESTLGFTPEMSAFIAAIYILFDTIITCGNVLGNSALVIILSKIFKKISKKQLDQTIQSNL